MLRSVTILMLRIDPESPVASYRNRDIELNIRFLAFFCWRTFKEVVELMRQKQILEPEVSLSWPEVMVLHLQVDPLQTPNLTKCTLKY